MNKISITEFTKLTGALKKTVMPCVLTQDGEDFAFVGSVKDVIYIGDMHPAVRNQFRGKEELVRKGMILSDVKVYADEVRVQTGK